MVRRAIHEALTLFGVDLQRLSDSVKGLDCGLVKPNGVLWYTERTDDDTRLDWFLLEVLGASGEPSLLFLELPLDPEGAIPAAAGMLPPENWLLWQMRTKRRLLLIYRPGAPASA